MGFFDAIKSVFSKYATFSGRASRSEYWWFALFVILWCWIPIINIIIGLFFFIPSLALQVRRLHDIGKSGWWWFINLVPVIGTIVMFVFNLTDSQQGSNQFGQSPKETSDSDESISGAYRKECSSDNQFREQQPKHRVLQRPEREIAYQESDKTTLENSSNEETVIRTQYSGSVTFGHLVLDGKSYPLSIGNNIIGRIGSTSQATIKLETDDMYMSRQHCIIAVNRQSDGSIVTTLRNYQNKNRTAVDGKVVDDDVTVRIFGECDITMGHTTLRYYTN